VCRRGAALDAEAVRGSFGELSEHLAARGVRAQVFVVGGAAMALAYEARRLTRDVDALIVPAPGPDEHPATVLESESLLVQVASPEYLVAMKLHASRDTRDVEDASRLFGRLGCTSAEQGLDLLARTYPVSCLLPRHRYVVQDVAERAAARRRQA
jgi:hypothetical protein